MAPRTSSRNERFGGRLSVIDGNTCSQSYGTPRTEISTTSGLTSDPAGQSRIRCKQPCTAPEPVSAVRKSAPSDARGATPARAQREPSVDQISTLVCTFSSTAPVNSVVVACPPRSTVLVPPWMVSSTDS